MTSIINESLASNTFPIEWKTAEVIPVLKEGDPEKPNNYHPISPLPALSKLCEHIALNQLMPYLVENDRLSAHQSGNIKWHFTETSLICTSDRILTAIDQKKTSAVVLLDMSKAFDRVNHDILLKKLQDVGLSPSTILWFKSYLSNRYRAVRINTALSEPLLMRYGVPQGSILSPLFFTAYTNDLPSNPQHCSMDCYVDDNKLLMSFQVKDCEPTMGAMNDDLVKLHNWCFNNRLLLNPDKTKLIACGSRQMISKLQDFRLTLMGKELLPIASVKDLGVAFDSKLSFNNHIIKTASSCMSALGQISQVKHIFRKDILVTIINSLVLILVSCITACPSGPILLPAIYAKYKEYTISLLT